MKFTATSLLLAALAVGEVAGASVAHHHGPKRNHAQRHAEMLQAQEEKRDLAKRDINLLSTLGLGKITSLGIKAVGLNPSSANSGPWLGTDGPYTNEFINQSAEEILLVIWGPAGSWVNAIVPQITVSIAANSSQTVSFPSGASGAWAPVYSNTALVNGQVSETWGEFTFGQWGVVDVSREVNMSGKNMKIVGPQCTTDMNTCVFVCPSGQNVCTYNYQLLNCAINSQPGANYGTYAGSPSGGCGGMGSTAALKTYLGY